MRRSIAPGSGIIFAVFVVAGMLLLVAAQVDEMTDQEIVAHYEDSGNRMMDFVGFILVTVGAMFFLWFLSALRSRLRSAETRPGTGSALAFGAGTAASALLVGSAAMFAATSLTVEITDGFVVDPNLALFTLGIGYLFLGGSVLVNLVLVTTTSVLALRSSVLPDWLGWVGFAAVVLAIVEAVLLPVFAIPVWVLIVSIVMMMQTSASSTAAPEPAVT